VPPRRRRALAPSLLATCVVAAGVAVVGWLLLLLLKGTVVLLAYALGIAMIAVPLLLARRLLTGRPRDEKRERIVTLGTVVAVGVVLCVTAHLVGEHGWLLIVLPVAAILLGRAARAGAVTLRRVRRR
jgi:phosphatidylserine synthase